MIDRLEELLGMAADEETEEEPEGDVSAFVPLGGAARGDAAPREDGELEPAPENGILVRPDDLAMGAARMEDTLAEPDGAVPAERLGDETREEPGLMGTALAEFDGPEFPEARGANEPGGAPEEGAAVPEELARAVSGWRVSAAAPAAEPPFAGGAAYSAGAGTEAGGEGPSGSGGAPVRSGVPVLPGAETGLGAVRAASGGLEGLYRAAARAALPAGESLAVVRSPERVTAAEFAQPETRRLTVGELDRAMRRDSRRYDGGMTIF